MTLVTNVRIKKAILRDGFLCARKVINSLFAELCPLPSPVLPWAGSDYGLLGRAVLTLLKLDGTKTNP
ncbi:MAG: hypothetical protein CR994_06785 [Maribacter sp.]|nr:MAG: hypothetical protein CR994_06785 [Maribacter sp.]